MTERERLIGELENYEPYAVHFPHLTVDGKLILDVLRLLREQPQWIRVEDRLPETRHAVLVYTPHYKNIWASSMHEDGNWYIWSPGGKVLLDKDWNGPITHWMPLPEPPEGVKQDD